jgi:hypothetical protein
MKSKLLLLLFLFLSVLQACKKADQKTPITILPLPYLPVYPGSSWVYITAAGDSVYSSTSPTYLLHSYQCSAGYTDPVYVPWWDGKPIYGYSTPIDAYYGSSDIQAQQTLLSDQPGYRFDGLYSDPHYYHPVYYVVTATGKTDTINGTVYPNVVINSQYVTGYNPSLLEVERKHYARNVGLIRIDDLDTSYTWHITRTLVRYHINR